MIKKILFAYYIWRSERARKQHNTTLAMMYDEFIYNLLEYYNHFGREDAYKNIFYKIGIGQDLYYIEGDNIVCMIPPYKKHKKIMKSDD